MLDKAKHGLRILFLVHLVAGFIILVWMALKPDMVIGAGQFDEMARLLETYDFKWWVVALVAGYWIVPIALVTIWRRTRAAGLEVDRVRAMVHDLLQGRSVPVVVDVDDKILLELDEPVSLPIHLDTHIDIDDTVAVDAEVPIRGELPLDAEITTKVPGIGEVKIPLRATLPVQMMVPIKGDTRLKATGLPIKVDAVAKVELRGVEVPIKARFETRIDLARTLETARQEIGSAVSTPPSSK